MREGEDGDTMYIILEGTVEVVKSLVKGDPDEEEDKKQGFQTLGCLCSCRIW